MIHIIDRFLIHMFSGPGVALAVMFSLGLLYRRTKWFWLPKSFLSTALVSVALVLPIAISREPFDVAGGQTAIKAGFDIASWALILLFPWILYRVIKWALEDPWIRKRLLKQ